MPIFHQYSPLIKRNRITFQLVVWGEKECWGKFVKYNTFRHDFVSQLSNLGKPTPSPREIQDLKGESARFFLRRNRFEKGSVKFAQLLFGRRKKFFSISVKILRYEKKKNSSTLLNVCRISQRVWSGKRIVGLNVEDVERSKGNE